MDICCLLIDACQVVAPIMGSDVVLNLSPSCFMEHFGKDRARTGKDGLSRKSAVFNRQKGWSQPLMRRQFHVRANSTLRFSDAPMIEGAVY
jgi:hypothetical protein